MIKGNQSEIGHDSEEMASKPSNMDREEASHFNLIESLFTTVSAWISKFIEVDCKASRVSITEESEEGRLLRSLLQSDDATKDVCSWTNTSTIVIFESLRDRFASSSTQASISINTGIDDSINAIFPQTRFENFTPTIDSSEGNGTPLSFSLSFKRFLFVIFFVLKG